MTSVDFNFNFLCGHPQGAGPLPRPPEPDPLAPPCGHHKRMAPSWTFCLPLADCHQTVPCPLSRWPWDLEWASYHTSSCTCWSLHLFLQYPRERLFCLTEAGLRVLLSRHSWNGAIENYCNNNVYMGVISELWLLRRLNALHFLCIC